MALTYRGRTFNADTTVAQTVETTTQGTYRGVSVAFRSSSPSIQYGAGKKQYRGVAY